MRRIFIIMAALIMLPAINAQETEVPKKANLVIIEADSLSGKDLYVKTVKTMMADGHVFDETDKDFLTAETKPVKPKRGKYEWKLNLSVSEGKINIRSYVRSLSSTTTFMGSGMASENENTWERGAKRSLSTSLWRVGWDQQVELAELLKEKLNGDASYLKEK